MPEKREEVTTEGGLDIESHYATIREVIKTFESRGIATSLFIDAKKDLFFLHESLAVKP